MTLHYVCSKQSAPHPSVLPPLNTHCGFASTKSLAMSSLLTVHALLGKKYETIQLRVIDSLMAYILISLTGLGALATMLQLSYSKWTMPGRMV